MRSEFSDSSTNDDGLAMGDDIRESREGSDSSENEDGLVVGDVVGASICSMRLTDGQKKKSVRLAPQHASCAFATRMQLITWSAYDDGAVYVCPFKYGREVTHTCR